MLFKLQTNHALMSQNEIFSDFLPAIYVGITFRGEGMTELPDLLK